jgi:hypothetical protein
VQLSSIKHVPTSDLAPGDQLAQDVMVGSQVLLRTGTVLTDSQVKRLQSLPLVYVTIEGRRAPGSAEGAPPVAEPGPAKPVAARTAAIPMPSFRDLKGGEEEEGWLAGEHFALAVSPPRVLTASELMFAGGKTTIRRAAGLAPLVSLVDDEQVHRDVHAAYMSSALRQGVNLEQLGDAAQRLVGAMRREPEGYLEFTDIAQYGQFLAARAIMSSKVFFQTWRHEGNGTLDDQVRGQFAMQNAYALLPLGGTAGDSDISPAKRSSLREGLLRYYSWLRAKRFVDEHTLELIVLQHESFDGSGLPYGLKGEMIPPASESWAVATSFSSRLFSQPKLPRATSRDAADHIIGQSGRAFSSRAINRFLTQIGYYPTGSLVELNDERLALVVGQNPHALLKPVVRLAAPDGAVAEAIDLQAEPGLFVRRQVMEY